MHVSYLKNISGPDIVTGAIALGAGCSLAAIASNLCNELTNGGGITFDKLLSIGASAACVFTAGTILKSYNSSRSQKIIRVFDFNGHNLHESEESIVSFSDSTVVTAEINRTKVRDENYVLDYNKPENIVFPVIKEKLVVTRTKLSLVATEFAACSDFLSEFFRRSRLVTSNIGDDKKVVTIRGPYVYRGQVSNDLELLKDRVLEDTFNTGTLIFTAGPLIVLAFYLLNY